ncbi:hypothetical protein [Gynuella sp.]|uniref:hypothetical protein n=1 Tax=Gynuella sp. TaxID=2969146 RepID=UPI003D106C6D
MEKNDKAWVSTLLFISVLLIYCLGFAYFGNLAIFNAWQTAFPKNGEAIELLNYRFWFVALCSLVCFVAFFIHIIIRIRKSNRQYRQNLENKND